MLNKTLIIAEAGVNHNGDINLAKKLIDTAARAGADYVKFQTFKTENLVTEDAKKAAYQQQNTGNDNSQFQMLKKLELTEEMHEELIEYCQMKNIQFLSTAFDFDSIEYLKDKLDFYKIPSGEITNYPYLVRVSQLGLPIVMSTGMANMKEVKEAFNVLVTHGIQKKNITILHCNTDYPTHMKEVNLRAMCTIGEELGVNIGYSDHTLGIEVPIAAVAMGAIVIEKHFTLDRTMDGPDHAASLEPKELDAMVSGIRNIELALGSCIKQPSESEKKNMTVARKSIVAAKDIKEGVLFSEENITVKRPGTGISPMRWKEIIGTQATKAYSKDELI